ncbi:MAG: endonuclease/exonuclease/phosphatase family protein [Planctomycetota bacterium]
MGAWRGVFLGACVASAPVHASQPVVRFASYNVAMARSAEGELATELASPGSFQAAAIAEVIQIVRPDVLLLNEFDFYAADPLAAIDGYRTNYLEVGQQGPLSTTRQSPITYDYAYVAPTNTGLQPADTTGKVTTPNDPNDGVGFEVNFDNDLAVSPNDPNDAYGFGNFPGQFGFVILSKYEIDVDAIRTFQTFLWEDMPGNRLPDDSTTPEPQDYYSDQEESIFRLSSKNHVDVPIVIDGETVHVIASHPTPPAFDGPEQRNVLRNADEIRLIDDYITPGDGDYIYDDEGVTGGLAAGESFVILGDLNSDPDPDDGDGIKQAIQGLLDDPRVQGLEPTSDFNPSDPDQTASFGLRADYALPSADLEVLETAVFSPTVGEPGGLLVGLSDHRLVYVDVVVPEPGLSALAVLGVAGLMTRRSSRPALR